MVVGRFVTLSNAFWELIHVARSPLYRAATCGSKGITREGTSSNTGSNFKEGSGNVSVQELNTK